MKCPKCNSENVKVEVKTAKNPALLGCVLALGGAGTLILGIIGTMVGAILGLIVGLIVKNVMGNIYESVVICQSCGASTIMRSKVASNSHKWQSTIEESNFKIERPHSKTGSAINLKVWLDGGEVVLGDDMEAYFNVPQGEYELRYEQVNGLGKNARKGKLTVNTETDKGVSLVIEQKGVSVNKK